MKNFLALAVVLMLGLASTANAQSFDYGTGGAALSDAHLVTTETLPWCAIAIHGGDESLVISTLDDGAAVFEDNTSLEFGTNDPNPSAVAVTYLRTVDSGNHLDLRVEGKNLVPHPQMSQSGFAVHYPGASEGTLGGYIPLAFGSGGNLVENISTGGGTVDLEYRLWEYLFGAPGTDVTEVTYTMTADCGGYCGGQ